MIGSLTQQLQQLQAQLPTPAQQRAFAANQSATGSREDSSSGMARHEKLSAEAALPLLCQLVAVAAAAAATAASSPASARLEVPQAADGTGAAVHPAVALAAAGAHACLTAVTQLLAAAPGERRLPWQWTAAVRALLPAAVAGAAAAGPATGAAMLRALFGLCR